MAIEDTSTLQAALKNTLVLDKGTGNPSFTRTTEKRAFNDDSILVTVPSGAASFPGARLAINNFAGGSSEDLTSTGWGSTGATRTTNAFTQATGSGYVSIRPTRSEPFIAGRTYIIQYRVEYVDWQYVGITPAGAVSNSSDYSNFDIINGTVNDIGSAEGFIRNVSGSVYDVALRFVCSTSGSDSGLLYQGESLTYVKFTPFTRDGTSSVNVQHYMVCDVTHEPTLQFLEYVSKGVASDPWHGAGVDGAKWFTTDSGGSGIPDATLKRLLVEPAATNQALWCRDATNAAWTKTNITAALDQTGIDNQDNTASKITSSAANGTCLQTITLSAATRSTSFYVKRITGTGTIEITRNGGTNWTDITSSINSSTYTRVGIKATSVTNPSIGFRIVTSGDAIAFDYAQDEAGSVFTSPILTTTATATRNADQPSYQTTSNFSDTAGAIALKVERDDWTDAGGTIGNGTSTGLSLSSSNSGVQAIDGTNTVNGPSGTPTGQEQLAIGWSGSTLKAASGGTIGTSGSYDGSFNLTTINIEAKGNLADLNIWTSALTDAQLQEASGGSGSTQSDLSAAGTGAFNATGSALFSGVLASPGTGAFSGVFSAKSSSDIAAAGVGALSGVGSSLFSSDITATGTGDFSGVGSIVVNVGLSADGVGAFSGVSGALFSSDLSAVGTGTFSGIGSLVFNVDLSAPGVGVASFESESLPELSADGVGGFDAVGASLFKSDLSAVGSGASSIDITALLSSDLSASGSGAASIDALSRFKADADMQGQSSATININTLFAAGALMPGVGAATFDLVQQGSDLSADGVGGATFLDAGTVPLLHVVNIDLEKYSETIDLSV